MSADEETVTEAQAPVNSNPPPPEQHVSGPPTSVTLRQRALGLPPARVLAWAVGSSVVLAIGSVAPWATASVLGIASTASGLHGGGWVTLITAAVGAIAVLNPQWLSNFRRLHTRRLGIWLVLLCLSLLVCILNYANIESYGLSGIVSPGWGLDVSLAACVVGIGADYVMRVQTREAAKTPS